jgi:hypothetical protein
VQAALAELQGVTSVEHKAGSDIFVVKHAGQLNSAVSTADRIVIFKRARRGFEKIGRLLQSAGAK